MNWGGATIFPGSQQVLLGWQADSSFGLGPRQWRELLDSGFPIYWVLRSGCRRQRSLSVHRVLFLAGVFLLPMLADGRADAHQPVAVFDLFQQIRRGEKLDAVGRRIAQRLDGRWLPWNPVITLILKPILNPIPMYARKVGGSMLPFPAPACPRAAPTLAGDCGKSPLPG